MKINTLWILAALMGVALFAFKSANAQIEEVETGINFEKFIANQTEDASAEDAEALDVPEENSEEAAEPGIINPPEDALEPEAEDPLKADVDQAVIGEADPFKDDLFSDDSEPCNCSNCRPRHPLAIKFSLDRACCSGEPWKLVKNECLNVGGWLQLGYHTQGANAVGTGLFNNFPNRVQVQQLWFYIEREADNGGSGWGWGYRADYVYGTDGQDTQAFGGRPLDWDNSFDNGPLNGYGHAIPQLYLDLAHDDNLNIKLGHFYTIAGYEVVPAVDNFFYSHAYTMLLAEPFTHTGVLAEYQLCGGATIWGGWTMGWDTGFSRNGGSTFLGGISKQLSDELSFTWTMTAGDFGFDVLGVPGSDSNGFSQSVVLTYDIRDDLKYIFQSDYVDNTTFVGLTGNIFGVNQYLLYEYNECLAVGARFEWIDLGGAEMGQATFGANIRPNANVLIRPEFRVDYFERGLNLVGTADSTVFGIDAIFTF